MTNHETSRALVRALDPTNEHERGRPCFVHHPDAGGRCKGAATMKVYGLNFCEEHGEEAKTAALLEVYQDAFHFFKRLDNPHVPALSEVLEGEIGAAVNRTLSEGPSDEDRYQALRRAFPNPPEELRERIAMWKRDEEPHVFTVVDELLDSLGVVHRTMRVAFEGDQTWLVEVLELERESVAAQAAYALREAPTLCEARPGE